MFIVFSKRLRKGSDPVSHLHCCFVLCKGVSSSFLGVFKQRVDDEVSRRL